MKNCIRLIRVTGSLLIASISLVAFSYAEEKEKAKPAEAAGVGAMYPLDFCIVSCKKLGEMGEPDVVQREGREIRFCCAGCEKKFDADAKTYLKKIDDAIIAQQKPIFPTDTCVVSGDKFGGEMGKPIDYVFNNRYLTLCCRDCVADLVKDPAKALAKLDEATIAKQGKEYPLETCPVSGEKLGKMGKPVDYVFAGRLARFCCKGCLKDFEKDPIKYMGKIDEAAKAKKSGK